MTSDGAGWTVVPEDVRTVRAYLAEHFPGAEVRLLTEPTDPGQLFQVPDREGTRYSMKILREALDDLRNRRAPLDRFLAKQEIARRLRKAGRVIIVRARGEDMIREGGA
jgi:hypothetical protein